jgi:hypothetical protein
MSSKFRAVLALFAGGLLSGSATIASPQSKPGTENTAISSAPGMIQSRARPNPVTESAISEAHEQWLAGAEQAAARFGCGSETIQQLSSESLEDAIRFFGMTAKTGSCLILYPISRDPASMRYSFASGGKAGGIDILYLSDVAQVRITHGAAVTDR